MGGSLVLGILACLFCLIVGLFVFNRTIGREVTGVEDGLFYFVLSGLISAIGLVAHFDHVVFIGWWQKIPIFLAAYIAPLFFLAFLTHFVYLELRYRQARKKTPAEKPQD